MIDKNDAIIAALKARQRQGELTQAELAAELGIHQGHLSKVLAARVPLSRKLRAKAEHLLQGTSSSQTGPRDLEVRLIQALHSSREFRLLLRAAIHLLEAGNRGIADGE